MTAGKLARLLRHECVRVDKPRSHAAVALLAVELPRPTSSLQATSQSATRPHDQVSSSKRTSSEAEANTNRI